MIRWGATVIVAFVVIGVAVNAFMEGILSFGKVDINYVLRNQPIVQLDEAQVNTHEFQYFVRLQRNQLLSQYVQYMQYQQYFGLDVSAQLNQIAAQLAPEGAEQIGQTVIDQLVNDLLIRQEAAARGITVSEEEIQARIESVFDYYPNGTPSPTVTPTEITFPTLSLEQQKIVTLTSTATIEPTLDLTTTATPTASATETPTTTPTETSTPTLTLTPDLTTTATATVSPTITETPTITPTSTTTPTITVTPTITLTPTITTTPTITPTFTPSPTATPYTLQGFQDSYKNTLEQYAELGLTEQDFRNLVISDMLRTKLYEAITADVKPFEEQVWARHILVADEETANSVRERLLKGEDFAVLAAELSIDTSNKDTGGDLGWFGAGRMVLPFETAAFALQIGEISRPVNTDFGWHIIQVIGHEDRPLSPDEFAQLKDKAFSDWLTEARSKAEAAGQLVIFDYWKNRIPLEPNLDSLQSQPQ